MAKGCRQGFDDAFNRAGQHIHQRRAGAAIGHEGWRNAGGTMEDQPDQVRSRAIAAIGHVERGPALARERDEFLNILGRQVGIDRNHHRQRAEQRHMGEVAFRIIADIGEKTG